MIELLHDLNSMNLFKPQKNNVVLDIGAHLGGYSLRAARMVGSKVKVIAIESNIERHDLLVESAKLNKLVIEPMNIAASNYDGHLTIKNEEYGGKDYSVVAKKLDNVVKEINLNHIDWIKIDVDGAENSVVDGMKNTLSITHNILIESRHYNVDYICNLLKDKFTITIHDHVSYLGKGGTCYILAKKLKIDRIKKT